VYGADRLAVAVYIGTISVSSALLTVLAVLVWRRPSLQRAGSHPPPPVAAVVTTATFLVALALGVLLPAVNYAGLLLLLATGPVERRLLTRSAGATG